MNRLPHSTEDPFTPLNCDSMDNILLTYLHLRP